jgi:hypothetical protein
LQGRKEIRGCGVEGSFVSHIHKLPGMLKDDTTTENKQYNDRQNANPSQNKKSCKPKHKPTQIAAHFILPNRTQAHPPPYKWTVGLLDKNGRNKGIKF